MNPRTTLLSILVLFLVTPSPAATRPRTPADLAPNSRQLFAESMRFEEANTGQHSVRDASWYALGLLLRDAPNDRAHAATLLNQVLDQQYLDPAVHWYGTYRRSVNDPPPPPNAHDYAEYDPNWREFIATVFQIILTDYRDRIPKDLATRLDESITIAVQGERQQGRLHPSYTNIALMYGSLLDYVATRDHSPKDKAEAAAWTDAVSTLFHQHNAFNEYNSPTYYGVDLYGLALWRTYGSTSHLRTIGAAMEATLWNDIADFYQPNLRNIAGPYDRSYGMDMETYTAVTGLWIRTLLPADRAPLPPIDARLDHAGDDGFVPMVVILGAHIPPPAQARLQHFIGPHQVTRRITDDRTATAWIGQNILLGAESTHQTMGITGHPQFHPATIQWRTPTGEIGWVNVTQTPPIDASASKSGIAIQTHGDLTLRIYAPGAQPGQITQTRWTLPGLNLQIATDATHFTATPSGRFTDITYTALTHITITPKP
jgi:hypothetical protein